MSVNESSSLYYFGYGANMSEGYFKESFGECEKIGAGILDGYKFTFSKMGMKSKAGFGNLVETRDDFVQGVVYKILDSSLMGKLDEAEGYPTNYSRELKHVKLLDGSLIETCVYIATPQCTSTGSYNITPTDAYYSKLSTAARDNSLDHAAEAIDKAKEDSRLITEQDRERLEEVIVAYEKLQAAAK